VGFVIKYLGSKRRLLPAILDVVMRDGPVSSAIDLFSGTSRVGHALKRAGVRVLSNDHNAYAQALARCYVVADDTLLPDVERLTAELNALPPRPGYFTESFGVRSRFVHPDNGARVDAIREEIANKCLDPVLEAVLLTSLMEATDRVDSTCGVQMAYLKTWAPRALQRLELRVPNLLPRAPDGPGEAHRLDAVDAAALLEADVAYVDPPYNQHSYLGNYHVWETLTSWDKPELYGLACKRVDVRQRKSAFNRTGTALEALRGVVRALRTKRIIVSFNDEGFIARAAMEELLAERGRVSVIAVDQRRYVGAQIGIYNPRGQRVGEVSHLMNQELIYVVDVEQPSAQTPALPSSSVKPAPLEAPPASFLEAE
jgi:adenine-specific DNA-methyltransferase